MISCYMGYTYVHCYHNFIDYQWFLMSMVCLGIGIFPRFQCGTWWYSSGFRAMQRSNKAIWISGTVKLWVNHLLVGKTPWVQLQGVANVDSQCLLGLSMWFFGFCFPWCRWLKMSRMIQALKNGGTFRSPMVFPWYSQYVPIVDQGTGLSDSSLSVASARSCFGLIDDKSTQILGIISLGNRYIVTYIYIYI